LAAGNDEARVANTVMTAVPASESCLTMWPSASGFTDPVAGDGLQANLLAYHPS
jgi:hypothetical protein